MKLVCLGLLLAISPALAAPAASPIELTGLTLLDEPPAIVANEQACDQSRGVIRTQRRTISGVTIENVHECGMSDEESSLVLEVGGVWFGAHGTTVAYQGANMTEAPMHIRMIGDSLRRGTMRDGSPAIVSTIDLRFAAVCMKDGCADASAWREQFVQVCPLASLLTREPYVACGSVRHRCPRTGCREVTLARGTLAVFAEGGPQWFKVSE